LRRLKSDPDRERPVVCNNQRSRDGTCRLINPLDSASEGGVKSGSGSAAAQPEFGLVVGEVMNSAAIREGQSVPVTKSQIRVQWPMP
jgi:hypothetical protein